MAEKSVMYKLTFRGNRPTARDVEVNVERLIYNHSPKVKIRGVEMKTFGDPAECETIYELVCSGSRELILQLRDEILAYGEEAGVKISFIPIEEAIPLLVLLSAQFPQGGEVVQ